MSKTPQIAQNLGSIEVGRKARIKGFLNEDIPIKLCEMGLMPGEEIWVNNRIPFNGPICVCLGKNRCPLVLRSEEATMVMIETVE